MGTGDRRGEGAGRNQIKMVCLCLKHVSLISDDAGIVILRKSMQHVRALSGIVASADLFATLACAFASSRF